MCRGDYDTRAKAISAWNTRAVERDGEGSYAPDARFDPEGHGVMTMPKYGVPAEQAGG